MKFQITRTGLSWDQKPWKDKRIKKEIVYDENYWFITLDTYEEFMEFIRSIPYSVVIADNGKRLDIYSDWRE